jgi:hypothetical protein
VINYYQNFFKRVPKNVKRLTAILAVSIVVLLAVMIALLVQIEAYRTPVLTSEEKTRLIVDEIGKSIILPDDELPTVATVADPSKLSDQPFFASAQVGDQVLIYPSSKRAILWRPSVHKVVEVSNLTVSVPAASTSTRK